jgi:hypothetical protein
VNEAVTRSVPAEVTVKDGDVEIRHDLELAR